MTQGGSALSRLLDMLDDHPAQRTPIGSYASALQTVAMASKSPLITHNALGDASNRIAAIVEEATGAKCGHAPLPGLSDEAREAAQKHLLSYVSKHVPADAEIEIEQPAPCMDPDGAIVFGARPPSEKLLRRPGIAVKVGGAQRVALCRHGPAHTLGDIAALRLLQNPDRAMRELCDEFLGCVSDEARPNAAAVFVESGLSHALAALHQMRMHRARARLRSHK